MGMQILDSIRVKQPNMGEAVIELCCGDLTQMEPADAADILVISAFPDDYTPTDTSLIGALHAKGVSVRDLAAHKAVDLREACCCWMSTELIDPPPGIYFRRILCFEPLVRGDAPQVLEDLFRGLTPFLNDAKPAYSVAMPLLASGHQAVPIVAMLGNLVRIAIRWMEFGLPLCRLRIVDRSATKAVFLQDEFARVKQALEKAHHSAPTQEARTLRHYLIADPADQQLCHELVQSLQTLRRQKIIEIAYEEIIPPGSNRDVEVNKHIEGDDVFLLLLSSEFLASDRCMAQAERALERHHKHEARVLPVLARHCDWHNSRFGTLPPLPTDGTPVLSWPSHDQAWSNVSGGIRLLSL